MQEFSDSFLFVNNPTGWFNNKKHGPQKVKRQSSRRRTWLSTCDICRPKEKRAEYSIFLCYI